MELKRLELCLSDATKQYTTVKEAAQVELKQRTMILQTNLDVLKDSEAREQQAQKAKREAADEIPKLMTKFKLERDTLRAEMTKVRTRILLVDLCLNALPLTTIYTMLDSRR